MDREKKGRLIFVTGLRNAHALESQAVALMKRQLERIESYPQVAVRLAEHLEETRLQIERLDRVLHSLGETASAIKDASRSLLGSIAAMTHSVAANEILRSSFANYAFEHYEIATYKSLCRMARLTGCDDALAPLQESLQEEIAMAKWLEDHIEEITSEYVEREQRGIQAGI